MIDLAYLHETIRQWLGQQPYRFMSKTYNLNDDTQLQLYVEEMETQWKQIFDLLLVKTALRNGTDN